MTNRPDRLCRMFGVHVVAVATAGGRAACLQLVGRTGVAIVDCAGQVAAGSAGAGMTCQASLCASGAGVRTGIGHADGISNTPLTLSSNTESQIQAHYVDAGETNVYPSVQLKNVHEKMAKRLTEPRPQCDSVAFITSKTTLPPPKTTADVLAISYLDIWTGQRSAATGIPIWTIERDS